MASIKERMEALKVAQGGVGGELALGGGGVSAVASLGSSCSRVGARIASPSSASRSVAACRSSHSAAEGAESSCDECTSAAQSFDTATASPA